VAAQVEAVRRTAAPAPDRGAARPDRATTMMLVNACAQRRPVRIGYRSEAGSEWVMEVDPWAVVVRHGRWYLLCWSHKVQAQRAYRIDRVITVELLEGAFDPPADLDPVAVLESHMAVGWEYEVEVIISAPFDSIARCVSRALGRLEAIDDDSCRLSGSTGNPSWYAEQLTTIKVPYRIVRCPELQAAARVVGQRLIDAAQ